jgi:sigma-B regulation protein RsbU (phosphoserine phosphatase)
MWTNIVRRLASWGMVPRTRLARFTLYLAGIDALLLLAEWILRIAKLPDAASPLSGWTGFIGFVLVVLFTFLAIRWFRRHLMWSVRNRLIVTYLFIGGVPVTLAMAMAIGGGYLMLEQLATFFTVSEIGRFEERLQAANAAAAEQITKRGSTPEKVMAADTFFAGRTVTVVPARSAPSWLKPTFSGITYDQGRLTLRAATKVESADGPAFVISALPVDQKFLAQVASRLGSLNLFEPNVKIEHDGKSTTIRNEAMSKSGPPFGALSAGSVPPAQGAWDREFVFGGMIPTTEWGSGSTLGAFLGGTTRLSTIYSYLTGSMELWTGFIGTALVVIAGAFAVVILIALVIGIRLTRTITYSVANLYRATQHVNRGEFEYQIEVRERDQLAALQMAFNSMTKSLKRLIAEQKEKERLQSELEIAHEVQEQLFPSNVSGTRTLEVYGICQPARTVSGDYYDFLCYGPDQMGIAVGDISGKGISAALLMATIHSAVRAYEQEQTVTMEAASAYPSGRTTALSARPDPPSPAQMLRLLNRHLFRSTQPEKYATLFLGFYDGENRRFTYSNGGHLAPIILGQDGSVRRLEAGGMVVGLFDNMEYEEETVEVRPGDIFIAFSDGMTEPENDFGEFGEQRLLQTILANRHLPLERIASQSIAAVKDWIGAVEQPDDITLVLARRID